MNDAMTLPRCHFDGSFQVQLSQVGGHSISLHYDLCFQQEMSFGVKLDFEKAIGAECGVKLNVGRVPDLRESERALGPTSITENVCLDRPLRSMKC